MNEQISDVVKANRVESFPRSQIAVGELFDEISLEVAVDGMFHPVRQIGVDRLTFTSHKDVGVTDGQVVPVTVKMGTETLLSADALVEEVTEAHGKKSISLALQDSALDMEKLIPIHGRQLAQRGIENVTQARAGSIDEAYRSLCSDVVHFLRTYRRTTANIEQTFRRIETNDADATSRAYELCEDSFLSQWHRLWNKGWQLVKPVLDDAEAVGVYKRYTEAVLTPEFMDGPIWRRSYEKPLGYPGDYGIMNYVYDWSMEGDDAYGKLCHRIGLEVGKPVATRMTLVKELILRTLKSQGSEKIRITSLGCGPAREVSEVLSVTEPEREVVFTLMDQDPRALKDAEKRISPLAEQMDTVLADYQQVSYAQLLSENSGQVELPVQDVVLCVGLFDYLPTFHAEKLVKALFNRLQPGGTLVIGNMKAGTDNIWPLKFILDWDLIYRDAEEMKRLGALTKASDSLLLLDETGYNYLLFLNR